MSTNGGNRCMPVAHRHSPKVIERSTAASGRQNHVRVRGHRVLDHQRVDVVAAADDQVLGAAGDVDAALRVGVAEVAAVEPAALDEDTRVVLRIAVAGRDMRAAHGDYAVYLNTRGAGR